MELNEFIKETLLQITKGIKDAQGDAGESDVNAKAVGNENFGGNLTSAYKHGVFTRVDFDVAVSAGSSGGGDVKLSVFGVGVEGGAKSRSEASNRISFAVPLRLPDGDKKRADDIERKYHSERTNRTGPSDF